MEKKLKNPTGNKNETPAPQESKWPDETIIRYIIRACLLLQGAPKGSCKAGPSSVPDSEHRARPWNSVCRGVYDDPQLAGIRR